jgi:hypothetical protein
MPGTCAVWLRRTTGGLLVSAGVAQLAAAADGRPGAAHARRIGLGTTLTLPAVDLVYVPRGRIRPTYLLDAAMQRGWIAVRLRSTPG